MFLILIWGLDESNDEFNRDSYEEELSEVGDEAEAGTDGHINDESSSDH